MTEKPDIDEASGFGHRPNSPRDRGSRRRLWISLLMLYLSTGFVLTFALRWQWIMPVPGATDFLDALFNPRIYLSAVSWPFWLLWSLL